MPRASINAVAVTGDVAALAVPGRYCGFTFYAAAAASVIIYDNASAASGTILEVIYLNAGESVGDFYPDEGGRGGIRAVNGVYVDVTGTVSGSVRVAT